MLTRPDNPEVLTAVEDLVQALCTSVTE
jgi:hypothetical protein